jgi:hypothetical protein
MVWTTDLSDVFLVDYEKLCEVCERTAHNNNDLARSLNQKERLQTTELIDLYYAQRGRCALTGWPLEWHESMGNGRRLELDHIVGKKAKQVVSNAVSGEGPTEYGKVACITNVQWVCRFANSLKEKIRRAELPFEEILRSMVHQLDLGYPLRSNADFLGTKGRREFRENFLRETAAATPGISASALCDLLAGTKGEAHYLTVIKDMKRLGLLQSGKKTLWAQRRKQALEEVVKFHGTTFESKQHFVDLLNAAVKHHQGFSGTQWSSDANKMGIVLTFLSSRRSRPARNHLCAGDRKSCLVALREMEDQGIEVELLKQRLIERGAPINLIDAIVDETVDLGAAYLHEGKMFASLTRAEAAQRIGVSRNRPKKWARGDWHDPFAGPAFIKKTKKGLTYYKRHEVDAFAAERGSHPLDLSVCGKRGELAAGGHAAVRQVGQLA